MALARRVLAVLITAALALAPVGASAAASAMPAKATGHATHAMHHSHGAMQAMASERKSGEPCAHKMGRTCCCDDKGTCAQTCLQKCFGQTAVLPTERTLRQSAPVRFVARSAARPPGWLSAPRPPPPRA